MITATDLQGHWRRDWIRAPGFEDATTHVHWLQAGDLFADMRVPADLPPLTGTCLADCDAAFLQSLSRIEGFAGAITVSDSQCTWHREINWQGVPDRPDVGAMSFDGDVLIEDGVHADYREAWVRQASAPLRGHRICQGGMTGILIESDDVFLLAIGPPVAARIAASLPLRDRFDSFYALGHWRGRSGTADLATNPYATAQIVLERGPDGFVWHAPLFDGGTARRSLNTIESATA